MALKKKKRGAVRKKTRKLGNPLKHVVQGVTFSRLSLLRICCLSSFFFAFYCLGLVVQDTMEMKVNEVSVQGVLVYQDRSQVEDIVSDAVGFGFVAVDLESLQEELQLLPWIKTVEISRKLPSGLTIRLVEHKLAAFWNENDVISESGDILDLEERPDEKGILALSGEDHKQVLSIYKQLVESLPEQQLPLRSVEVTGRSTVIVKVFSGAELVLNESGMSEQLDRWRLIAQDSIGDRLNTVDRVDLRYTNGAAVSWKQGVALSTSE